MEDVKYEIFIQLLEYMYTGCITFTDASVMEIFAAANQYRIESLLTKCGTYLSDVNNEKNVCVLLEMAHMYSENELYRKCYHYIEEHTADVMRDTSFLNLPEELVIKILESDELQIDESTLFTCLINWGKHRVRKNKRIITIFFQLEFNLKVWTSTIGRRNESCIGIERYHPICEIPMHACR